MELASQTFARYQKLFESRSVSPQEMDEIRTRRDAAQADLASRQSMVAAAKERVKQVEAKISQARAQAGRTDVLLSYTRIVAPEPGIVVQKSVDAGSAIFPGTPLLTIDTTGRPQVLASLPVEQAGILHVGMQCRLRGSQSAPYIQGRVAEIIPLSDPATHSIQFKVDLDGNSGVIHGEYLKLEIPAGTRDAMLVQRSALVTKGQLEGVLVVEGGNTARFRLVKTAPYDAEKLEILSGVEQGESIIIHSESQIIDGMPVEIEL
jgi:RND family efflux transporter MFP subunit